MAQAPGVSLGPAKNKPPRPENAICVNEWNGTEEAKITPTSPPFVET